jgi:hypothetical protein
MAFDAQAFVYSSDSPEAIRDVRLRAERVFFSRTVSPQIVEEALESD